MSDEDKAMWDELKALDPGAEQYTQEPSVTMALSTWNFMLATNDTLFREGVRFQDMAERSERWLKRSQWMMLATGMIGFVLGLLAR